MKKKKDIELIGEIKRVAIQKNSYLREPNNQKDLRKLWKELNKKGSGRYSGVDLNWR